MNILYLTNTRFAATPYRDASTRYRCYHPAESLVDKRYVADVGVLDVIDIDIVERYDVVVVLRPSYDRRIANIANLCKQKGITLIADFDDLIFRPELAEESPLVKNSQATTEQIRAVFQKHKDALSLFDQVTVSTQELVWQINEANRDMRVLCLPNGLSRFWLKYNKHVANRLGNNAAQSSLAGDITYLPGTRSHDHDFETVNHTLANAVNSTDGRRINVIGALDLNESLFSENKLVRGSWRDYFQLPEAIASSWLTIAPLAKTKFNQCKSHIKFIESAAFGTPHISSSIQDVSQHDVEGLSIVSSTSEWQDIIDSYAERDYYEQCSKSLAKYAREHCMASNSTDSFLDFAQQINTSENDENSISVSKAG